MAARADTLVPCPARGGLGGQLRGERSRLAGALEANLTGGGHLRALARFGFVEEVGTGPGRRRPWRALDVPLAFSDVRPDEQSAAAARALSDVLVKHWLGRLRTAQATRHDEPPEWQDVLGGSQAVAHVTVDELRELVTDLRAVLGRYDDRLLDVSRRPDGSRAVELLMFAQPYRPPAADPEE